MYVSILDYRKGEVLIIEVDDITVVDDGYVIKRLGHTDYTYMTTEKLILTVNNEC